MERRFSSGSRQTPDPYDQYLEQNNYYRKHTARDASSLFRVISEQMYDTQMYHMAIRGKCVTYMRKYRQYFEGQVNVNFDEYLNKMSKPTTKGTLLELQAVSYMFQRSVILFEPYNLGNYLNKYHSYFSEVFRVFYTPELHFDSVYTTNYIEEAAKCQSLCYEILYQNVFKLPDITFAVEQMLHSNNNVKFETETNADGYTTCIYWPGGPRIDIDLPQNTNCILENHNYCHFHFANFPQFSEDILKDIKNTTIDESEKATLLLRTKESFLPDKNVSCVRQLLREGITPFPYKVAKALDPNMYRNIEFDAWSEMRKEERLKHWYNGDPNFKSLNNSTTRVDKIFRVGAKCLVKLSKSEQDLYTCYVQEVSIDKGYYVVFVEQLGERRLVPYDALKPLPANQIKPRSLPYGLQRYVQKFSPVGFTRHCSYQHKFNNSWCKNSAVCNGRDIFSKQPIRSDAYIEKIPKTNIQQFMNLENFHPQPIQYCTMPLTINTAGKTLNTSERCENVCVSSGVGGGDGSSTVNKLQVSSNTLAPHSSQELDGNDKNYENNVSGGGEGRSCTTNLNREHEVENRSDALFNSNSLYPYHGYYSVHPYGLMDEHFGYYDNNGGLHASTPSASAFLPLVNGLLPPPFYHFYSGLGNPHMPTSSHIHGPAAATLQPFSLVPSPRTTGVNSPLMPSPNSVSIPPILPPNTTSKAYSSSTVSTTVTPVITSSTTITGRGRHDTNRNGTINTRINFDAKKSVKLNGADLPADIATLRYFYNLGLDFYHRNFRRNTAKTSEDGVAAINDITEQSTPNRSSKNVNAPYNHNKTNVNSKQLECNKIIAKNNVKSAQCNVKQNMDNTTTDSNYNNTSNKGNQRRYNMRYYKREQQQGSVVTSTTENKENNQAQNNQSNHSSSIRLNKGIVNAKYPTTNKTATGVETGAGVATVRPNTNDYKARILNPTPPSQSQHQSNNDSVASMQMNNNVVQIQTRRTPIINSSAYMTPQIYNNDGIIDTGNSRVNAYMWNSNGAFCGAAGYDGGNCDYNCENILATSMFNGNLASYAATTHGLCVPMPITGQIPSYQIPLPSAAANMNMGIHSIPVNGGNGGGGSGPGGGGNGTICHDHFMPPNSFMPVNSISTYTPTGTETHKGPLIPPGGGVAVNMLASQCNYHPLPIYYTDTNASMQQSSVATATAAATNSHTNHSQSYWGVPPTASSTSSSPMSVGHQYKTKRNHNNNINYGHQPQISNSGDRTIATTTESTVTAVTMNCIGNQQIQQTNNQANNSDVITVTPPISAQFNDKISNDRV